MNLTGKQRPSGLPFTSSIAMSWTFKNHTSKFSHHGLDRLPLGAPVGSKLLNHESGETVNFFSGEFHVRFFAVPIILLPYQGLSISNPIP
jgi:hypothetical protein